MVEKVVKTVIIVIFISFTFFLTFGHVYTVKDTGNANAQTTHQIVSFAELTVSDVINKASISLREEDVVTPTLDATLDSGEINIVRSRPISVTIDKKTTTYYTTKLVVSDFLESIGVKLGDKDYISIPVGSELTTNSVVIKRYYEKEKVVRNNISYDTKYVKDPMVAKGVVYLKQEGKPGVLEKHYKEVYFGGEKIKEVFTYEKVTKAPVTKVYVEGTASSPTKFMNSFYVLSTAYAPTVAETDSNPWITASGLKSNYGVVAVDPKVIPLGTLLYVEGYGYAVAGDTGGAIKGNKIDVFFYYPSEARDWGVRRVKIYILDGKWKFQGKLDY